MNARQHAIDPSLFNGRMPLHGLSAPARAQLTRRMRVESCEAGQALFKKGDDARYSVYLLEGEVSLSAPLAPEERISAGAEAARYPLAHHFPRPLTARAATRVQLLIIDGDVAELVNPSAAPARPSWKDTWLSSPLFRRLSCGHLDTLLTLMEEVPVQAGQMIIRQDEAADCYYVIKQGRCSVSRRPAPRARDVKLAELNAGQGFGEEALITNATRNASITMLEDGALLRLGKDDFIQSLATPLLRHMPYDELLAHRGAVLVDVRTPEEFETDGLVGSLNMPMPVLRLKAHRLDPARAYVVYSNTGHFSTAAAFILLQQGLDAYVLKDGLSGVPRHRLKHAPSYRHDSTRADASAPHAVVDFPGAPGTTGDGVKFDWVSDEAMWRNTIGLREDDKIESLFAPSDMYRGQAADTSHQGFEDVRLFTRVGSPSGARLSLSGDEGADNQNYAAAAVAGGHQGDDFIFGSGASRHHPVRYRGRIRRGLGRTVALAALMLTVGFAAAFWTSDDLRSTVSDAPHWLQKQRDLDAKVSRLLDNIEKLPAMQAMRAPHPAESPPLATGAAAP